MSTAFYSCTDAFVSVSLLLHRKALKKKVTLARRHTSNPVWNESIQFNVPLDCLPNVGILLRVMDYDLLGNHQPLGEVCLGPREPADRGKHWTGMTENHQKVVSTWHALSVI